MDELGVSQISDEQYIAIGKAAVMWWALAPNTTHPDWCPHYEPTRAESLGLSCNCGLLALEQALTDIWSD